QRSPIRDQSRIFVDDRSADVTSDENSRAKLQNVRGQLRRMPGTTNLLAVLHPRDITVIDKVLARKRSSKSISRNTLGTINKLRLFVDLSAVDPSRLT